MHETDDAPRVGDLPELMTSAEYRIVLEKVRHLHSLMQQHDKLTELAINKSEASTNERFAKANEFREQQKDIITRFAPAKEMQDAFAALSHRMDENNKAVTARYESSSASINSKIETLSLHLSEKIEMTKRAIDEKREALYSGILTRFEDMKISFEEKLNAGLKSVDEKMQTNLKSEAARFNAIDNQMKVQIDTNAEISNRRIDAADKNVDMLNAWKDTTTGSITVLRNIMSVILAIVVALVIAFFTKRL